MAHDRMGSPSREATWWWDIPRRNGSPFRAEIHREYEGAYAWRVDCPMCGLRAGHGVEDSVGRAETAAKRWAVAHER